MSHVEDRLPGRCHTKKYFLTCEWVSALCYNPFYACVQGIEWTLDSLIIDVPTLTCGQKDWITDTAAEVSSLCRVSGLWGGVRSSVIWEGLSAAPPG